MSSATDEPLTPRERVRDRLIAILEATTDFVAIADADGNVLHFNQAARRMLGIGEDENISGIRISDTHPPWANEIIQREAIPTAIRDGVWRGETALLSRDGREIPVSQVALVHKAPDGSVEFLSTIARDISQRKRAEEALRESEARFRTVTERALAGVYIFQAGKFRYVNPALAETFGYTPDEIIDKLGPLDLTHPDDRPAVVEHTRRRLEGDRESAHYTFRGLCKDGTLIHCEVLGRRVEYQGRPAIIGTLLNITDRVRAEQALRESQRTLSILMSNLPGMAYRCRNDREWTMEFVSDGCYDLTGYQPTDLIRNAKVSYAQLIHPEDREQVWNDVQAALKEDKPFRLVYRIITAGGERKWVWEQGRGVASPEGDVVALEGFITDITKRVQAEEALRQHVERLRVLHAIDRGILEAQSLEAIAQAAVRHIRQLIPCQRTSVTVFDLEAGEAIQVAAHASGETELGPGVRFPLTIIEDLQTEKPRVVEDIETLAQPSPLEEALRAEGVRSFINVPLIVQGELIGSLNLGSGSPGGFSSNEVEIAREVADQLAIAARQARLFEAERTRRQELDALYRLARQLVSTEKTEAVLNTTARHAVQTVHVTFCRILSLDEDDTFVCRAAHPIRLLGRDLGVGQPAPAPAWSHYQRALNRGTPVVLHRDDPGLSTDEREALLLDVAQSLCLAPLQVGDEVVGLMALGEARSPAREPFDADKLNLITAIADQATSAIHRTRLHEELESSYIETVLALAKAMDARDTYTAHHSQQLAEWAEATAQELGCAEDEIEAIQWGALLHDIGKIGVPDNILRKPGSLTDEEWAVIKRHPEIGAEIVEPVKKLADVAPIIRAHQEHWDGNGYPDGLRGEAIPLGARILTVVDAYSAITDERPYKAAGSHKEAVTELQTCAGTQFDPQVVEAFLETLEG